MSLPSASTHPHRFCSTRRLAAMVVGLTLALTGCPDEWAYESDFEMKLGRYQEGFQPFAEGVLPLEAGWQGGQHIPFSLQAEGIAADTDTRLTVYAVAEGTDDIVVEPVEIEAWFESGNASWLDEPAPDGWVVYYGGTLVVAQPDDVVGEELELRVSAYMPDQSVGRVWNSGVVEWDVEAQEEPR